MAKTLVELIWSYDNLDEEPMLLNHPRNIIAITISFMVRGRHLRGNEL